MVTIELANRSGVDVEEDAAIELARSVLAAEGIDDGELGLVFVGPEEMQALKREHLGVDEVTDVLSFPIDGRAELPMVCPDSSATPSSARRSSGMPGGSRSSTACYTSSATTTATR